DRLFDQLSIALVGDHEGIGAAIRPQDTGPEGVGPCFADRSREVQMSLDIGSLEAGTDELPAGCSRIVEHLERSFDSTLLSLEIGRLASLRLHHASAEKGDRDEQKN